jgi:hypothetical protein
MKGGIKKILAGAAATRTETSDKETGKAGPRSKGAKRPPGLYDRLGDLYARMEKAYRESAERAGLSCVGCTDNCCTSFFRHHTYVEWTYLWRGLLALPEERRQRFIDKSGAYLDAAKAGMAAGAVPSAMCPLNEDGLCAVYPHRLMICRMHGTRNRFSRPDGQTRIFPGCVRFTALPHAADETMCPTLDRTPFYSDLAALELAYMRKAGRPLPRVNLTIAEMIVLGLPKFR